MGRRESTLGAHVPGGRTRPLFLASSWAALERPCGCSSPKPIISVKVGLARLHRLSLRRPQRTARPSGLHTWSQCWQLSLASCSWWSDWRHEILFRGLLRLAWLPPIGSNGRPVHRLPIQVPAPTPARPRAGIPIRVPQTSSTGGTDSSGRIQPAPLTGMGERPGEWAM